MANSGNNSVSVVHLIWLDFGIDSFRKFLESYIRHPAGYPHELVLLFNGVEDVKQTEPYLDLIMNTGIKFQTHLNYSRDQDLTAYIWVAERVTTSFILYLNSYSEFLEDGWLAKYMVHCTDEKIGIIGATGSWMSYYRTAVNIHKPKWEGFKSIKQNLSKCRTTLKAFLYWKWLFPDFPNPHIRTNAFLISRDLMLQIKLKPLTSKLRAYSLESGKNSITRQVMKKGMRVMVMDKNGVLYKHEDWDKARVFWISSQENLLIADNQTQKYAESDLARKKELTHYAWGI